MPKVKICGLISEADAAIINENQVEYGGIVVFYPKSKRNCSMEKAGRILRALDPAIKRVAVTVSPGRAEVEEIAGAGFNLIQIHGQLKSEVLEYLCSDSKGAAVDIIRAHNIKNDSMEGMEEHQRIIGYLADGRRSGSGEVFDWTLLSRFQRKGRLLILAGGLNSGNVEAGLLAVRPDIVDVSTGVESASGNGKDAAKVKEFVRKVRGYE